jgi:hypothetical protein
MNNGFINWFKACFKIPFKKSLETPKTEITGNVSNAAPSPDDYSIEENKV